MAEGAAPDLILHGGRIHTLDRARPLASAMAIRDGRFQRVGSERRGAAAGRPRHKAHRPARPARVLPGLIDNHIHIIRGGLNFNLELRWDGVHSLADAMAMLRRQVAVHAAAAMGARGRRLHRAPVRREAPADAGRAQRRRAGHAGFHPASLRPRAAQRRGAARGRLHQGHARSRLAARSSAMRAANPPGCCWRSRMQPSSMRRWRQGPKLPLDVPAQLDAPLHARAEPAGRHQRASMPAAASRTIPTTTRSSRSWPTTVQLTVRIAYNLFTQKPKQEKEDFLRWTGIVDATSRATTTSATTAPARCWCSRPPTSRTSASRAPTCRAQMEDELEAVVRILAQNRWPWRLHATYDETITPRARCLRARATATCRSTGLHWFFDHAETISDAIIDRIAALGGGIAVQHRMAYQGEYFVERYGAKAAEATPPVRAHAGARRPGLGRHRRHARGVLQPLGLAGLAGHRPDASAACSSTRSATASTARPRCGCGPRTSPGSPTRKGRRGRYPRASSPT